MMFAKLYCFDRDSICLCVATSCWLVVQLIACSFSGTPASMAGSMEWDSLPCGCTTTTSVIRGPQVQPTSSRGTFLVCGPRLPRLLLSTCGQCRGTCRRGRCRLPQCVDRSPCRSIETRVVESDRLLPSLQVASPMSVSRCRRPSFKTVWCCQELWWMARQSQQCCHRVGGMLSLTEWVPVDITR